MGFFSLSHSCVLPFILAIAFSLSTLSCLFPFVFCSFNYHKCLYRLIGIKYLNFKFVTKRLLLFHFPIAPESTFDFKIVNEINLTHDYMHASVYFVQHWICYAPRNTKRKSPHIYMFAINMLISVQCSVFTWVHVVCWWCMLVHFVYSIWLRCYNVVFYLCSFLFNFFECIAASNLSIFNWKLLRSILYAVWIVKCP